MLIPKIKLSELIDSEIISSMMESFYNLTGIPMALIDLEGNVIAGGGWQGICTKFHRKHPETLRNCINSDTKLTTEIPRGEFRLYKCKNNHNVLICWVEIKSIFGSIKTTNFTENELQSASAAGVKFRFAENTHTKVKYPEMFCPTCLKLDERARLINKIMRSRYNRKPL